MAGTTAAVSVLEARWASLMPDAAAAQPPDDAPSPSPSSLAGPGSVGTWHGGHGHLSLVVEVPGPGEGWAPWREPLPRVPGISSRVRAAQVLSERAAAPGALGLMSAQDKLEVVQAAEVVKAHLDAVAAEAAASMFADIRETVTGGEVNEADLPVSARDRLVAQARSLTVEEIQAATGWGSGQCWRQVSFALAPAARSGFAKARLREGASPSSGPRWWWSVPRGCRPILPSRSPRRCWVSALMGRRGRRSSSLIGCTGESRLIRMSRRPKRSSNVP